MNLSLAPIQGITNAAYRKYHSQIFGGIDEYYSPFIATTQKRDSKMNAYKDILAEVNDPALKLIPQLLGNHGGDFNHYAKVISHLGYREINWNIGCPSPTVTKKKKGSGILSHPDLIDRFLDEVCASKDYDLTVKMRLGMTHKDEGKKVVEILNQYPLKGIIVHGRTGLQKYEGQVDLDGFQELYQSSSHPVTYNGDIYSLADFRRIQQRFPNINDFMLARGVLQDPFLPSNIKNSHGLEKNDMTLIQDFHQVMYDYYKHILSGDKHLIDKMGDFWTYLSLNLDPQGIILKKIKKCRSLDDYHKLSRQLLNQLCP